MISLPNDWRTLQQVFAAVAHLPVRERVKLLTIAWNATTEAERSKALEVGDVASVRSSHLALLDHMREMTIMETDLEIERALREGDIGYVRQRLTEMGLKVPPPGDDE